LRSTRSGYQRDSVDTSATMRRAAKKVGTRLLAGFGCEVPIVQTPTVQLSCGRCAVEGHACRACPEAAWAEQCGTSSSGNGREDRPDVAGAGGGRRHLWPHRSSCRLANSRGLWSFAAPRPETGAWRSGV